MKPNTGPSLTKIPHFGPSSAARTSKFDIISPPCEIKPCYSEMRYYSANILVKCGLALLQKNCIEVSDVIQQWLSMALYSTQAPKILLCVSQLSKSKYSLLFAHMIQIDKAPLSTGYLVHSRFVRLFFHGMTALGLTDAGSAIIFPRRWHR